MARRPGNPGIYPGEHVIAGLAAGFNPLRHRSRRAEAHRLARRDVLPALQGGVSVVLPTPIIVGCVTRTRRCVCGR